MNKLLFSTLSNWQHSYGISFFRTCLLRILNPPQRLKVPRLLCKLYISKDITYNEHQLPYFSNLLPWLLIQTHSPVIFLSLFQLYLRTPIVAPPLNTPTSQPDSLNSHISPTLNPSLTTLSPPTDLLSHPPACPLYRYLFLPLLVLIQARGSNPSPSAHIPCKPDLRMVLHVQNSTISCLFLMLSLK